MNIYVGNLASTVSESDLRTAFEAYGQVANAAVIKDKFTGESRGFGFVEMPLMAEAQAAISNMNGKDLNGKTISVNEARPRPEGGRGGDRFGGRGGGGGRFGGGDRRGGGRY
ncbi:MAG: RNA-binding protein [Candidatus Marinimicrobia bacterium]|jgi:RNA recognition motif-containing protein|nr:RNA-binding protein [Candidatus Neomarinimicrobiota bacterium]MCK9560063.1 RNA-binding protein [Candidatus Neomarinimicrobiota bacterium]